MLMKIHNASSKFKINISNIEVNYLLDNEYQFIKYIEKTVHNCYIDFLRQLRRKVILNTNDIEDVKSEGNRNNYSLTNKERDFLNLFYKDGQALTEKEVAKKLGISQQAVSKRKRKIYQKIAE